MCQSPSIHHPCAATDARIPYLWKISLQNKRQIKTQKNPQAQKERNAESAFGLISPSIKPSNNFFGVDLNAHITWTL